MPLTEAQLDERDAARLAEPDPDYIWLMPKCESLDIDGRGWCTEPQDCDDIGCGMKSVKYIRADLVSGIKLPEKCNYVVAEFLSDLGWGFSVGERVIDGRKKWKELRKLLLTEQKADAKSD